MPRHPPVARRKFENARPGDWSLLGVACAVFRPEIGTIGKIIVDRIRLAPKVG